MISGALLSWSQRVLQAIISSRFSPERVHYARVLAEVTVMPVLERYLRSSVSGMVLPLGMPLELRGVEVDLAQVAGGVTRGFIVEVCGGRMAANSRGSHGLGVNGRAELDNGHKAVPAGAIPLLGPRVAARRE